MARLRAALLLVDHGSFADVSSRVEALTADTNTLRHTAREALGLSAWKEGKTQDALKLFDQIAADDGAPRNTRERATLDVRADPRLGRVMIRIAQSLPSGLTQGCAAVRAMIWVAG